jgi:rod shape determining protein RodA
MNMLVADGFDRPQLKLSKKLLLLNWPFLLLIAAIATVGVAALYSVAGGSLEPWASRHVVRFCIGLALIYAVVLVDIRWWMRTAYPFYLVVLVLLALVPLIGVESGGAQRWIGFGEYSFQPSEIMKIALVLALARYYQWLPPEKVWRPDAMLPPLLMVGLPTVLALAQPDLGTAALFGIVGCGIMFLAGVSWVYFIAAVVGLIAVLPHLWERLHDYQKDRVLTLIDPERDPLGSGYHILQSKIAIGSGGIWGKGFLQGSQSHLDYLPEGHTDFVFATMAEEWGLLGGVLLILAFGAVIRWGMRVSANARTRFAQLAAAGLSATIFFYVSINLMMVMGLAPVVGVPLPLVSFGGSAVMTVMLCLGLLMALERQQRTTSTLE